MWVSSYTQWLYSEKNLLRYLGCGKHLSLKSDRCSKQQTACTLSQETIYRLSLPQSWTSGNGMFQYLPFTFHKSNTLPIKSSPFKDNSSLMIYLSHPTGPQLCSSTFTHSLILSTGTTDFPPAAKQTNSSASSLWFFSTQIWSEVVIFVSNILMPKGLTTFFSSIASWLKLLLFFYKSFFSEATKALKLIWVDKECKWCAWLTITPTEITQRNNQNYCGWMAFNDI